MRPRVYFGVTSTARNLLRRSKDGEMDKMREDGKRVEGEKERGRQAERERGKETGRQQLNSSWLEHAPSFMVV